MLADLHEEFASDGWTAALEAAAGSALAAATTSATCLGLAADQRRARPLPFAALAPRTRPRLAAGSPPLRLPLLRYLATSSSRAHASASTAASLARCARCSAGPRWRRRCRRRRLRRRSQRARLAAVEGAAARRRRADRAVVALCARRAPPLAARPAARGGCGGRPAGRCRSCMRRPTATAATRLRAPARRYLWWVLVAETLPAALPRIFDGGDADVAMRAALPLAAAAAAGRLLTDRDALSAADGALQRSIAAQLRAADAPVLRERLVARLEREWCGRPLQFGALAHASCSWRVGCAVARATISAAATTRRAAGRLLIVRSVNVVERGGCSRARASSASTLSASRGAGSRCCPCSAGPARAAS